MIQLTSLKFSDETKIAGRIETSTVSFESAIIVEVTFDSERVLFLALQAAIVALSLGLLLETKQAGLTTFVNLPAPAADPNAQRERKWRMVGHIDDAARGFPRWSRTIPAADIADKLVNEERLDPTAATAIALKAAIEAYVQDDGDAVVLDDVLLVGRNL